MATTIGKLSTVLTANTKPFERGMRSAAATTKGFGAGVVKVAANVAKFGVALGTVAAAGMTLMVKNSFAAIDATAKMADRIGIATEKLVGLRHAAGLMGATTQELDKSLEQMTRRLGEANAGSGITRDTLLELGMSSERLSAMAPDVAFGKIADAINRLPTAADRANAAYNVFGRTGIKLLNTLSLGSNGLNEMQAEAERLGITFTRFDAAKIEQANDAFARVKLVVVGIANDIAIGLAPWVQALSERFVGAAREGGSMGDVVVDAIKWIAKSIAFALDAVNGLILGFKMLSNFAVQALNRISQKVLELSFSLIDMVGFLPDSVNLGLKIGLNAASMQIDKFARDHEDAFTDALLAPTFGDRVDAFFNRAETRASEMADNIAKDSMIPEMFEGSSLGGTQSQSQFGQRVRFRSEINTASRTQNDPIKIVEKNTKVAADESKKHTQQNERFISGMDRLIDQLNFGVLTS